MTFLATIKIVIILMLIYRIITDDVYDREFIDLIKTGLLAVTVLISSILILILDVISKAYLALSIIMLVISIVYIIKCALIVGQCISFFICYNHIESEYDIEDILHFIVLDEEDDDEYDN